MLKQKKLEEIKRHKKSETHGAEKPGIIATESRKETLTSQLRDTCDLLKNLFRSSKKNRNLSIYLQEYVYPIKERNAYMKNAMFIN